MSTATIGRHTAAPAPPTLYVLLGQHETGYTVIACGIPADEVGQAAQDAILDGWHNVLAAAEVLP